MYCPALHSGLLHSTRLGLPKVKARTRVVRVAEYVEYSGPKALLTLTRVATLMCDPTTHTHPSSKQVELVTTHEYSEYSLSGGNRLFSRRRLRLSAGSCALHNYMVRPSYPTHARRRRGLLRGKRRCRQVATKRTLAGQLEQPCRAGR